MYVMAWGPCVNGIAGVPPFVMVHFTQQDVLESIHIAVLFRVSLLLMLRPCFTPTLCGYCEPHRCEHLCTNIGIL
jgi:hypothetical protein